MTAVIPFKCSKFSKFYLFGKYYQQHQVQHSTCQRLQSSVVVTAANETKSFEQEWANAKPYKEIPSLKGLRNVLAFFPGGKYYKMPPADFMRRLKNDVGSISRFDGILGRQNVVVTHNVEDFITVFRNEGIWPDRPAMKTQHYHRSVYRADFFKGVEGVISTQGEKWAKFRSIVNPVLMQPRNVCFYLQKMSQVNKEFVERIRQIRDPKTLEVPSSFVEEINRWTLESVSVVALDKQLGLINRNRDDPLAKDLFQAMNGFFNKAIEVENTYPIWKYYKTEAFKSLMNSLDTVMFTTSAYTNEAIRRIQQDKEKGVPEKPDHEKSVLEQLIKIDKKIATVMAMDMLMAGTDTTSSTFAGLLLCLAKNPDKQANLREEVKRILPHKDSEFTEESMRNIPYLRACIKECLRLYPIVVANSRVPTNNVVLSGYQVPKGTHVAMTFVALLGDDAYFPRAKEFLPERWLRYESLEENEKQLDCPHALKPSSPFVHLPFGFGPRMCVGRRIVEMELEIGIARIIRNFHVEYNYPTENAFKSLLIYVPQIPLTFKFTDIED